MEKVRMGLTQQLYNWMLENSASPKATWILAIIAFAESSVFPIPPDMMIIPMLIADKSKAWKLATICTVSSVLGGLAGYAIGYFLFESIGLWIIEAYSLQTAFESFQNLFQEYGIWIIMLKGLTPIPYKLVTIASGATGLGLVPFVFASIISRSLRFFILSGSLYLLGDKAKDFMDKNLKFVFVGFLVTLILGIISLKYLF